MLFLVLAYAGLRWPLVLALGSLLHAAWDGGLHLALEQPVTGAWLPLLCLPFDVLVAAYLAYMTVQDRVDVPRRPVPADR